MRKPKLIISKCLNSEKCRYNGQSYDDKVISLSSTWPSPLFNFSSLLFTISTSIVLIFIIKAYYLLKVIYSTF